MSVDYFLNIESHHLISQIKEMVAARSGVDPAQVRLLFMGKELVEGGKTVAETKIQENSTIFLAFR